MKVRSPTRRDSLRPPLTPAATLNADSMPAISPSGAGKVRRRFKSIDGTLFGLSGVEVHG